MNLRRVDFVLRQGRQVFLCSPTHFEPVLYLFPHPKCWPYRTVSSHLEETNKFLTKAWGKVSDSHKLWRSTVAKLGHSLYISYPLAHTLPSHPQDRAVFFWSSKNCKDGFLKVTGDLAVRCYVRSMCHGWDNVS